MLTCSLHSWHVAYDGIEGLMFEALKIYAVLGTMKRHGLTAPAKTSRARTRRLWRIVRTENPKQRVSARHKSGERRGGKDRKNAQRGLLGKHPVYAVYAVHGCSRTSTRDAVPYPLAMRDRVSRAPNPIAPTETFPSARHPEAL